MSALNSDNLYAITRFVDGCLLYVHFDIKNGYYFKLGMLGYCAFKKVQAEEFLVSCGLDGMCILKLNRSSTFNVVQSPNQEQTDKIVKKAQKSTKKRLKKQRQKLRNAVQGPEIEEAPVPPTTY